MKIQLALIQMNLYFGDPEKNRKHLSHLMTSIDADTEIVILPELWNTAYQLEKLPTIADKLGTESKHLLHSLSLSTKTMIVGGSVATRYKNTFSNELFVFDNKGMEVGHYKKVHLFPPLEETQYFEAGRTSPLSFLYQDQVQCGALICYDLRFPEWISPLVAKDNLSILFITAQWPIERIYQWKQLCIARAIENQLFIVAVNRVGTDPSHTYGGNSLVINPLGHVVAEASQETEEILYCQIDLDEVDSSRKNFYRGADMRSSLYRALYET